MKNKTKDFIFAGILIIISIFIINGIVHFVNLFFIEKNNMFLNTDLASAYYYTLSAIIQSNSALIGFIIVAQTFGIQLINNKLIDIMELKFNRALFTQIGYKLEIYEGSNKSLKRWLKLVYLSYISLIITIIMALLLMRYTPNVPSLYSIIWVEIGAILLSLCIVLTLISIIKDMHQIIQEINILLFEEKRKSDGKL